MSCLFNSLSKFVPVNSTDLRNQICDYLLTDPILMDNAKASEVIQWESNVDLNTYVNNMRKLSTWGGAIEIRCFVKLYNISVHVMIIKTLTQGPHKLTIKTYIEFISESNEKTIKISWNGFHYEPVFY
jgi:hypothetical protein